MEGSLIQTLKADLPPDTFVIKDFLGVKINSYYNKKTGKSVLTSVGIGKYGIETKGREPVINPITGQAFVTPPDFIYKITVDELDELAEKLPSLAKAVKLGNTFSWKPEKVVKEATNMTFMKSLNQNLDQMKKNDPTLWQLNGSSSALDPTVDSWAPPEPRSTGNAGFGTNDPWGISDQSLLDQSPSQNLFWDENTTPSF